MPHTLGNRVLVVAAHPDDEVLGCGGTLAQVARVGGRVQVVFLTNGVDGRLPNAAKVKAEAEARRTAAMRAAEILAIQSVEFCDFPDNRLDTVALLDLVQVVERFVANHGPQTVLTHHSGDLNVDHRRAHDCVMTACRPQPNRSVERVLGFEVPSSTEWISPGSHAPFVPNLFVDVEAELPLKRRALEAYAAEMRAWPHSRSYEAVEHLARWRGASVGRVAAEAFVTARWIVGAPKKP